MQPYERQGYQLFTDNFYTSHTLARTLKDRQTGLVGTVNSNRRGFPAQLKNIRNFQRNGTRGDMRYFRVKGIAYIQWLDKRVVTVLSTIHSATNFVETRRMVKSNGRWKDCHFRQPEAISCYNKFMCGVDIFDQLASGYRLLRRSKKFTKSLFYDMLEIAVINSFKLMQEWRKIHPGVIQRRRRYAQSDFRKNLIRQLAGISLDSCPPLAKRGRTSMKAEFRDIHVSHAPVATFGRGSCPVCWKLKGQRVKSSAACSKCLNRKQKHVHLCIKPDKSCFALFHSPDFDQFR